MINNEDHVNINLLEINYFCQLNFIEKSFEEEDNLILAAYDNYNFSPD